MNNKTRESISEFFNAVRLLQDENVITTKDYSIDIYKFIAKDILGFRDLPLFSNNCPHKQPCRVSMKTNNGRVIVVLGPVSNLKSRKNDNEIHYYEISIEEILQYSKSTNDFVMLGKDFFESRFPSKVYKIYQR